jgi:putative nucleotidyltransferase with HDIG domain
MLLGCVGFVQGLRTGAPVTLIAASAGAPLASALVSAVVIIMLLPVIEWLLGEISDISLTEYGCEHPLLDQLKERAPGTWHHTLNVADLAEKAAAAIGARPLLCKTAALYHDIGKLKDPGIFAENIDGPSPHEQLDPKISAQRIIEHVSYGLELARKYRLPRAFRQIIAEHHGSTTVRYFYAKARAQLREGDDPEALRRTFSYPGPRPASRESGIVSLADMIEAATRAKELKSDLETRCYVRSLIAERVSEGELAHCPLTLAELALAEGVFFTWVKARHHNRPAYPKAVAELGASPEWSKAAGAVQPA